MEDAEVSALEGKRKPPGRARPGITTTHAVLVAIVVSMMSSVATIVAYDRWVAQKVVAVAVSGFLQEQRDLVLAKKIPMADFKANLERYLAALKSQPKNKVLILEDVIASKNLERMSY